MDRHDRAVGLVRLALEVVDDVRVLDRVAFLARSLDHALVDVDADSLDFLLSQ